ncbi:Serine/threonine exchanger SteT [Phycisphaerae bacterium RAS1]|nr:Serine/threonine exchanger SteT [Phycisphaerae bacterium RAS1]
MDAPRITIELGDGGLQRALGTPAATAFVIGNMVGAGIWTVPALVHVSTGNPSVSLLIWLGGGLLALCGALSYAELGARLPLAGGDYQYLSRCWGPMTGFIGGWITLLAGFSASIASVSLVCVSYAHAVFGYSPTPVALRFWAILLMAGLTVYHAAGIRASGGLQTALSVGALGTILLLLVAGFSGGNGDWRWLSVTSKPTGHFGTALIEASFAYSGWNAAAYLAGETRDAPRTLPRALIGGTILVTAAYFGLNVLFFYAVPPGQWTAETAVGTVAAMQLFGKSGASVISLIIAFIIIGATSAMIAAGPRILFAMARDGVAPHVLAGLGTHTHAPARALYVQGGAAILLALSGAFDTLITYIGAALSILSAVAVAGLFILRKRPGGHDRSGFRVPGFPVIPAIYIGGVGLSLFWSLGERPYPTVAAIASIALAASCYVLFSVMGWMRVRRAV